MHARAPFRRRYLFVLGHMRSYSSLLCHILGSHRQIDGYCETHIKYRTQWDLIRLRLRVVKFTGEPLRGCYVLDKVLHNYSLAPSILRRPDTLSIVLLRRPIPTIQSIINMGLRYSDIEWHGDLDSVICYYEERLANLVRLADQLRGRVVFIEAEALLSRTTEILQRIAAVLELNEPLRADYRRFAHTGERGFGDPSEAISLGRVDNTAREQRTALMLPPALAARLEAAYSSCADSLRDCCVALAA
jgi:hypothetical protein